MFVNYKLKNGNLEMGEFGGISYEAEHGITTVTLKNGWNDIFKEMPEVAATALITKLMNATGNIFIGDDWMEDFEDDENSDHGDMNTVDSFNE